MGAEGGVGEVGGVGEDGSGVEVGVGVVGGVLGAGGSGGSGGPISGSVFSDDTCAELTGNTGDSCHAPNALVVTTYNIAAAPTLLWTGMSDPVFLGAA